MQAGLALALGFWATAGAAQSPVAIVEEIDSRTAGVEFMDYLFPGQVIRLEGTGTMVVSYLKSCWREKVVAGTVFEAASLSKPVFAYAVLWMAQRGELDLDKPLIDDVDRVEVGDEPTRLLLEALGTLNERYQHAISLRYLSGLSHEEAADAMGISKPVMAVTLSRALKALKKAMDKMGPREEAS